MSRGMLSPVIYRPLFEYLRFVTCRTFETVGASTIPIFGLDAAYIQEIYGDLACELVLPEEDAEKKIEDILRRPEQKIETVRRLRQHMVEKHSYKARIQQLLEIIRDQP
jgi:glycosyltransferase involved in cell wall biosynthesis